MLRNEDDLYDLSDEQEENNETVFLNMI